MGRRTVRNIGYHIESKVASESPAGFHGSIQSDGLIGMLLRPPERFVVQLVGRSIIERFTPLE